MVKPLIRLGTRGSPLALAQAAELCRRLAAAHPELVPAAAIETVIIRTTGDSVRDRTLAAIGGKGLFTKELEEALLAGTIDCAVHSMKDMPTALPEGLRIAALLPREDPRDAFISLSAARLADLPAGAVVGTASLRRQAQLLHARPDLKIVPLRGNVGTRLKKLADGELDATLLALAGLKRLGLEAHVRSIFEPSELLPAVAQGAIGIETRIDDDRVERYLSPLNDHGTETCVTAERAFLAALDGSCRTPIAGLATFDGNTVHLSGMVIRPDGSARHIIESECIFGGASELGATAGEALKAQMGPGFLDLPFITAPPG